MGKDKQAVKKLTMRSYPVVHVSRDTDLDAGETRLEFTFDGDPIPIDATHGMVSAMQEVGDLYYDVALIPNVEEVIENGPATIIKFADGSKSVAVCEERDVYSRDMGLMVAALKAQNIPYDVLCQIETTARMVSALTPVELFVIGNAMVMTAMAKWTRDAQELASDVEGDDE